MQAYVLAMSFVKVTNDSASYVSSHWVTTSDSRNSNNLSETYFLLD